MHALFLCTLILAHNIAATERQIKTSNQGNLSRLTVFGNRNTKTTTKPTTETRE